MQLQDGWDMDTLWERTDFVWTLTWLGHGCFVGTRMLDANTGKNTRKRKNLTIKHTGLCVDVNMVGTWMLCGNTEAGCKHWKEHRTTQKPHDKTHQNAAYLQKTHTISPAMCKKHRRMPGKIRRAHLLYGIYKGTTV